MFLKGHPLEAKAVIISLSGQIAILVAILNCNGAMTSRGFQRATVSWLEVHIWNFEKLYERVGWRKAIFHFNA